MINDRRGKTSLASAPVICQPEPEPDVPCHPESRSDLSAGDGSLPRPTFVGQTDLMGWKECDEKRRKRWNVVVDDDVMKRGTSVTTFKPINLVVIRCW